MRPAVRIRDDDYQRSSKDAEEDMISFKPDWMKGNEAKTSNTRDRQNEKWRGNSSDPRRTRPDTRDWNKGSSTARDTRGWGDRGRGAERSNPLGFSSNQPKGRFVPPPMSRSQSAGALFSPKDGPSQTSLLFSKEHLPPVVKVPAPATPAKSESAFKLNPESDFPSLQPSPSVEPPKKQNDARSRFLKSKSTNALLEQNGGRAMSNGSFLLGKASAQEEIKGAPLANSQAATEGDVNGPAGTSVDNSVQDVPSQEEQADKPKKLKKIPSFSEKVVEAMTANQATAKPETNTNKEDEQVLMLVPSKPAPPRLIKSRSDRGHLLDHVRKPAAKPLPSKGAETVAPPKPQPEVVQISSAKSQLSDSVTKPRRTPPSPSVYRKATSEPQLLHLWKKDGVPAAGRALAESSSSDDAKKEGNKNGRVVDKQLELRQQKRNLFLEQLRRREAIKNGEVLEEEGNGEQSTRQEGEEDGEDNNGGNQNVNRFSEEAVVSFMKQLGWSEEEDEYLDEGLTEEELLGVHPLDTAQLSKQREMRKETLAQSLRQWQPPLHVKGAATNGA